jgi:hypothetical protein
VRRRRLAAFAGAVLFLVVVALLFRSCLDSRAESRLRDYNRDVGELVARSDSQVSRPLFEALRGGGADPVELEARVNELGEVAERHVQQAEDLDVPDELRAAQRNLLLTLDLRETGVRKIAGELRSALGRGESDSARDAITSIAAEMQGFLASDVVYDSRVRSFIAEQLEEREIGGQAIGDGQFLPSLEWLTPASVGQQLGRAAAAGGATGEDPDEEPEPGRHGHALTSVTVGDETLAPGEEVNRIPAGANTTFTVAFANQGDSDEEFVPVRVRVGAGGDAISASGQADQTEPGATAEVEVPLPRTPPIGVPVEVEVTVGDVPGEELTENNTQTYTVVFQQ